MREKFEKAKEFVEDHSKQITLTACIVCGIFIGRSFKNASEWNEGYATGWVDGMEWFYDQLKDSKSFQERLKDITITRF